MLEPMENVLIRGFDCENSRESIKFRFIQSNKLQMTKINSVMFDLRMIVESTRESSDQTKSIHMILNNFFSTHFLIFLMKLMIHNNEV